MKEREVVMITGCSTGLGREMCEEMSRRGYFVVATARKVEALKGINAALKLEVDVTEPETIRRAIADVMEHFGRIDILINNAGYSIRGAIEDIELDKLEKMFDVNVFGIINMTKEVLPEMRKRRQGKIVNIGSISGLFSQAVNGGYCASKYAVEAINRALRLELKDFGIQSTVIEPGATETNFFNTLAENTNKLMENQNSPYESFYQRDLNYRKHQKRAEPKVVAQQICKHITKKKLKMQYAVGVSKVAPFALKHCPNVLLEYFLNRHAK